MEEPEAIKVCLLGDSGVGKSSIALRFVSNEFRPYSESTIGASFTSKTMDIPEEEKDDSNTPEHTKMESPVNSRTVSFKIWDTAGQEKYHSLASMYYRNAAAAVVVYDIANSATFRALKMWVNEVRTNGPKGVVLAICGNKSDLSDHRQVKREDAEDFAEKVGAFYVETSARDDVHVHDLFLEVGKRVLAGSEREPVRRGVAGTGVNLGLIEDTSSSKCC